jgi:hypothetical protein
LKFPWCGVTLNLTTYVEFEWRKPMAGPIGLDPKSGRLPGLSDEGANEFSQTVSNQGALTNDTKRAKIAEATVFDPSAIRPTQVFDPTSFRRQPVAPRSPAATETAAAASNVVPTEPSRLTALNEPLLDHMHKWSNGEGAPVVNQVMAMMMPSNGPVGFA